MVDSCQTLPLLAENIMDQPTALGVPLGVLFLVYLVIQAIEKNPQSSATGTSTEKTGTTSTEETGKMVLMWVAGGAALGVSLYICYLVMSAVVAVALGIAWFFTRWQVWAMLAFAVLVIFVVRNGNPKQKGRSKGPSSLPTQTPALPVAETTAVTDAPPPEPNQDMPPPKPPPKPPPPIPPPTQYWVSRSGKVKGPLPRNSIVKAIQTGEIRQTDEIASSPDGPWSLVSKKIRKRKR